MLFAFVTGKESQDYTVEAFARGAGADILTIKKYLDQGIPKKCTGVIFAGMLRGNMLLYQECMNRGIDYYYMDHAYFNSGYNNPHWMRITRNHFVQNNIVSTDPKRWNQWFQRPLSDYNFENRRKILVLPPSPAVQRTFGVGSWREKIIKKLQKHTNKKIIVRDKGGPVIHANGVDIINWEKHDHAVSIDEMWQDIYCVVAFNSNLAIEALIRGIPVITTRYCAAWPLSNKIENIDNLLKFNRGSFFHSLSYGQFNYNEMRSGEAMKKIITLNQVVKQ